MYYLAGAHLSAWRFYALASAAPRCLLQYVRVCSCEAAHTTALLFTDQRVVLKQPLSGPSMNL